MTVTINQAGLDALLKQLTVQAALPAAKAGAAVLKEKLSGEGSGVKYATLPRRSSTPQEYPAEQSGGLKASIKAQVSEDGRSAEFGSIDGPDYVAALLFRPPGEGGRPFLEDAYQDQDVRKAVVQAFADGMK